MSKCILTPYREHTFPQRARARPHSGVWYTQGTWLLPAGTGPTVKYSDAQPQDGDAGLLQMPSSITAHATHAQVLVSNPALQPTHHTVDAL